MRTSLILLFFLLNMFAYSQESKNIITEFEREFIFLTNGDSRFNKDSILTFLTDKRWSTGTEAYIERTIDFGHWQTYSNYYDEDVDYAVLIQGKGNKAYLAVLYKVLLDTDREVKVQNIKLESNFLSDFLSIHKNLYKSWHTIGNCLPGVLGRFGIGCGLGGTPTAVGLEMYSLVVKRDKINMLKMAQSIYPEERTMGMRGLYYLQKLGMFLTESEKNIIRYGQQCKTKILYCRGCIVRRHAEMSSFLKEEDLNYGFQDPDEYCQLRLRLGFLE